MGRRARLDMVGFHHVVNRGIERSNVYRSDEDKEKFLEILCDYKQVEVARYLGISDSAVSKVFLAMNKKSGDS